VHLRRGVARNYQVGVVGRALNPNSTNPVLPFLNAHSGPPMDSAIVSGTLFTLAIGLVMAGIAFMMM
jgi:hypothetical protein